MGRRAPDHMVVGFTITYAINTCDRLWFSLGPPISFTYKTDRHDIAKILLKVTLNTIKPKTKHTMIVSSTVVKPGSLLL